MEHTTQTPAELPYFSIAWKSPMSEHPESYGSYTISRSTGSQRKDVQLSAYSGYYKGHENQGVRFLSAGKHTKLSLSVVLNGLPEGRSYYVSLHNLYTSSVVHPAQKSTVAQGRIWGHFNMPYTEHNPQMDRAGYIVVVSEDEAMSKIVGISNPVWVKYLPDYNLQSSQFHYLAAILTPVIGWAQIKVPNFAFGEVAGAVEKISQWLNLQNHTPIDWDDLFADHVKSEVVYSYEADNSLRPSIQFSWKTQLMLGTVIETTLTFPGDGSGITASIQQNGQDLGDFNLFESVENLPFIILTPEMRLKYDQS